MKRTKTDREKNNIVDLLKDYELEYEKYYTSETESAPSGEWEEYNVGYLQNESYCSGMRYALIVLGYIKELNLIESRIEEKHSYE